MTNSVAEARPNSVAALGQIAMQITQIFIDILHFNEVTVDVVEVEAARESLVIGSVWGMARERMQDNDKERLQNTGEDDKLVVFPRAQLHQIVICSAIWPECCIAIWPGFCNAICHRLRSAYPII